MIHSYMDNNNFIKKFSVTKQSHSVKIKESNQKLTELVEVIA